MTEDTTSSGPRPPRLVGLVIGDDPQAWQAAGFTVRDDVFQVRGVTVRLAGSHGPRGVLGWQLEPPASSDVDGLPHADAAPVDHDDATHANGVDALDHVVVASPDLERTTSALATIGLTPRRTVVGARGDAETAYRFFLLETSLLELIAPTSPPDGDTVPAAFVGLAFATPRIDDLGSLAPPARPAIQPGRRITTLDHGKLGLSVPTALLSPR
jgi:hypothetical protein